MKLSVSYTKAINKRFQRAGVLFQGQFQAKPILTSSYLLNLCRYIHGNPVKDGLVAEISQWPYSNYLEWIGIRNGKLVDKAFIQENFDTPEEYRTFVLEYLRTRQLPEDIQRYLDSLETWGSKTSEFFKNSEVCEIPSGIMVSVEGVFYAYWLA